LKSDALLRGDVREEGRAKRRSSIHFARDPLPGFGMVTMGKTLADAKVVALSVRALDELMADADDIGTFGCFTRGLVRREYWSLEQAKMKPQPKLLLGGASRDSDGRGSHRFARRPADVRACSSARTWVNGRFATRWGRERAQTLDARRVTDTAGT